MEFTTGLMSLDTALNEMLSRVTPLTAQETLPLVQCFGRILASDVVSPQNIRRRGEDISAGAVVFPAGTRLTTAELPVIASLGIAEVPVIRKVRVALFSTGDELQLPGQPLGDGQIYDTNRLAVHLMLEQLGCEVINLGIIRDDPHALRAAFIEADSQADVVISSGPDIRVHIYSAPLASATALSCWNAIAAMWTWANGWK